MSGYVQGTLFLSPCTSRSIGNKSSLKIISERGLRSVQLCHGQSCCRPSALHLLLRLWLHLLGRCSQFRAWPCLVLSLDTCQCPGLSLSFCPEGKLCFPCLEKRHLYPLLRRTGGYSHRRLLAVQCWVCPGGDEECH